MLKLLELSNGVGAGHLSRELKAVQVVGRERREGRERRRISVQKQNTK